ncbi:hypothetical protein EV368DRAFT_68027 [Lentinula lateritia]|nr:hypothetical protein EV368DRAFT_68027 [Lentinula lateritia]
MTMEEPHVKDMSDLFFAKFGVNLSPEQILGMSLEAANQRKMVIGQSGNVQAENAMDVGSDRELNQATMRMDVNDLKTTNLDITLRLKAHIDSFLSDCDSQLEKLALDQLQIPLWKPDFPDLSNDLRQFIRDPKIPQARAPNDHLPNITRL